MRLWTPFRQALLTIDICIYLAELGRIPRNSQCPCPYTTPSCWVWAEAAITLYVKREVILIRPESFKSRKFSPAGYRGRSQRDSFIRADVEETAIILWWGLHGKELEAASRSWDPNQQPIKPQLHSLKGPNSSKTWMSFEWILPQQS